MERIGTYVTPKSFWLAVCTYVPECLSSTSGSWEYLRARGAVAPSVEITAGEYDLQGGLKIIPPINFPQRFFCLMLLVFVGKQIFVFWRNVV